MKKASENIEKYRKTDLVILFKTILCDVIKNAKAEVKQKSHDFLFEAIVFSIFQDIDEMHKLELFKQRFKELLNFAVFPFYWLTYEPEPGITQWNKILPVNFNGITTKRHTLNWKHKEGIP